MLTKDIGIVNIHMYITEYMGKLSLFICMNVVILLICFHTI